METNNERRLRKLKLLCTAHGIAEVAAKANLKPVYLGQILKGVKLPPKKGDSSRSERALGDAAARAIEEAYNLGRGWFDNDSEEESMSPKELQLIGLFREMDEQMQKVVLANVHEAVEERSRMLERISNRKPMGDRLLGGRDSAGTETTASTRPGKRGGK